MNAQRRHVLLFTLAATLGGAYLGWKRSGPATPIDPEALLKLARQAHGFSVNAGKQEIAAYVFFDPLCAHCADVWRAANSEQVTQRTHWIPVAGRKASLDAVAAILASADPAKALASHEASLLAGGPGIDSVADISSEVKGQIEGNRSLFANSKIGRVPVVVRVDKPAVHIGSFDPAGLTSFLAG
jgi:thiol:disulfide interchange protein DsbG